MPAAEVDGVPVCPVCLVTARRDRLVETALFLASSSFDQDATVVDVLDLIEALDDAAFMFVSAARRVEDLVTYCDDGALVERMNDCSANCHSSAVTLSEVLG